MEKERSNEFLYGGAMAEVEIKGNQGWRGCKWESKRGCGGVNARFSGGKNKSSESTFLLG